jgi:hypothetical protein
VPFFDSLMEDGFVVDDELTLLAFNIKKEIYGNIGFFLFIVNEISREKINNMFSLTPLG